MSALGGGLSGAAGESKHVYPTFLIPHSLNPGWLAMVLQVLTLMVRYSLFIIIKHLFLIKTI